ncbi:hypothetical protein [Solicola gregarius]|uniref:DUF559 domain-containing protein n=1 Tax=Solicola gregarius TaxID=2908642 RepID=A0AA46TE53_9ACTN|nr:hypothetical protein [Solicola gregarius]UYM03661.1 hypothetical protein L0C25_14005 [Solicola gregarius]
MSEARAEFVRTVSESTVTDQDGVLATWQAVSLFGRHRVAREVRAGRWHRPARGVVVLHNGPLSIAQQRWVALLACARGSVLGGITALRCDGFTGLQSDAELPRVVQPMGARVPPYASVNVHWSEYLDERDVHPLRQPVRHRPARAAIDEASWTPHPAEKRARAFVLAVVQQRLATPRHFREALERRGACRHRALIVESILDAAGGIQSLPERDFDNLRSALHLPEPTRQAKVKREDGRYYLDVEWKAYDTACEIHGIPHMRIVQWESDLARINEITIDGPRVLIFSSYAVRRLQDRVADQLVRMLRRGGWRG